MTAGGKILRGVPFCPIVFVHKFIGFPNHLVGDMVDFIEISHINPAYPKTTFLCFIIKKRCQQNYPNLALLKMFFKVHEML